MNTINSVYYGWGFLILCGGGSYYFAKRSVTADRQARYQHRHAQPQPPSQSDLDSQRKTQEAKATQNKIGGGGNQSGSSAVTGGGAVGKGKSPDGNGGEQDGMKHVKKKLEERDQKRDEGSEFESQKPFRSRKGDRFS